MKEIKLGSTIIVHLSGEGNSVRIKFIENDIILPNQDIENVSILIQHNFNIVNSFYELKTKDSINRFEVIDINIISINVVIFYLHMYNSWRSMYKKQENRDLRFINKDFDNPSTHDILFRYFRGKYPMDWKERCSILLGMDIEHFNDYYEQRNAFYNK